MENPNLLQPLAAAKIGTTPKLVPEVGPKVQSAPLPCPVSGQPNVLQPAGQINVLAGISMQEFMEDDSMQITFVHPNSGISMQELIDFDSMPVAFNRTQNSGPVFGPTNLPCHEPKSALMQTLLDKASACRMS